MFLDLLLDGKHKIDCLLGLLLSGRDSNFGVFKLSLQVVVSLLKLLDLLGFLLLSSALGLLLLLELVKKLSVVSLGHDSVTVANGRRRAVALIETCIAVGAAAGDSGLEGNLDPGAFILALGDRAPDHVVLIVAELGQIEVCLAQDAPSLVTGNRELRLSNRIDLRLGRGKSV